MLTDYLQRYGIRQTEKNDIAGMKKKLAQSEAAPLTKGQINDIQSFYKRVAGTTVPVLWHQYFFARNGLWSEKYVPTCFYHKELIYRMNDYHLRHAYVDKGVFDVFFPDVNRPKTIVKNMNGYFYDAEKPLTREEALERCQTIGQAIIKPSQEGMWGQGVNLLSAKDDIDYNALFNKYDKNFIIQQRVVQHEQMGRLNPTSLNTLRVLSYRHSDEIHVLYAVVRIGRLGKNIDNETAGGINADISLASGRIIECAYGTPSEKKIMHTDCGTELKGFAIPSFDKVVANVKELHKRLPYFNIVGWDWGIDAFGEPTLIEWNRCPDLSQTAHGPAFGEMTEMIIKDTLTRKDTRF